MSRRILIPLINLSSHGGIRILVELANFLARTGLQVAFLVPRGRIDTVYVLDSRVKVRQIGWHSHFKTLDYLLFLIQLPFFIKRDDYVIANFFPTLYPIKLAAILKDAAYVYFVQDIEAKYTGVRGFLLNLLCNMTYKDRNIVAANSFLAGRLKEMWATPKLCICIGPSDAFFKNRPGLQRSKQYDILYFIRRESWKRLDRFDRIMMLMRSRYGRAPSVLCVTQDAELLQQYSTKGYDCVKPKDDAELISLYDSTKILLLTSDREGFGLPPLEAMARGLPAVVYRCGGPDTYISHQENSFLIEDGHEDDACNILMKLLDNPDCYRKVSTAAIETAERYRLSSGLKQFADYLATPVT